MITLPSDSELSVESKLCLLLSFALLHSVIGLEKLTALSQPIRSQTNRVLLARVFPRLTLVTCICLKF